jgi:transcriptional regulator with XRE-family HTH domain
MTGPELKAFRKMVGRSQSSMAEILGYGRRQYQMMERGIAEIRHSVDLACAAYALGIHEYHGPTAQAQWKRRKGSKEHV